MILIPWKDELSVSACCEFSKHSIDRRRITDYGFLSVWGNRIGVFLMSNDKNNLDLVNYSIAYTLDNSSYRIIDTPTYIDEYIAGAQELDGKLWIGEWVPLTKRNMFKSSESAHNIARCIIGFITDFLDIEGCLTIISDAGDLPYISYRYTDEGICFKRIGKTITLEDYLSNL